MPTTGTKAGTRETAGARRHSLIPTTSPIDNRILEVYVPVADLERARAWYCALLDVAEPPIVDGRARLDMQGVGLTLTADPDRARLDEPVFALQVEDIAAADAFLRQHGIQPLAGSERRLTFRDPDGNMLMACTTD